MSSRKTISRLATLGGISTAVALAATGCGAGGAASPGSGGNSINVLVEAGGHAELQPIAEQCKKDTGINVNFVELPYDGLYNRLSSEFSSGTVSFDVAAHGRHLAAELRRPAAHRRHVHRRARRTCSLRWSRRPSRRHTSSECRSGRTPRSLLPQGPVRGRQGQGGVQGEVRLRPGRPDNLAAVQDVAAVLHPRHGCTAPTSRARWRPSGWPMSSRPARRPGARHQRQGDHRRRRARGGAGLLHRPQHKLKVAPPGRGPGRLGCRAEPVQPGQDRDDPVLGPRLPADPEGLHRSTARSASRR